jgi:hypothetical protein
MRAVRALLAVLALLLPAACDEGTNEETHCVVQAHCADVSVEGARCCAGVCVDCYVDSDGDGMSDCVDPDYLDGACLDD